MAQEIKNVLLMGASGNLGPSVLHALVQSGKFNVTVTTREGSSAQIPAGVKVLKIDYSNASLAEAFKGQDAVISNLGGKALAEQTRFIDIAVEAGVKRFIPSEFGSNTANQNNRDICPVFVEKYNVAQHLKEKAEENPNFSWTCVMCGPFYDWELRVGFAGFDLKSRTATIWDSGDGYWSATNLASVGKAVVGVLLHPEETKNRYVWIESFRTSQNETLAALEKATGEKWTVKKVKCAEQIEQGREAYRRGDPNWFMQLIIGALFNEELDVGADFSKFAKLDNDLLGVQTEDIQDTVDKVVKEKPQFDWKLNEARRVILTTAT